MNKLRIGITVGDINGIGLEVIIKTLANSYLQNFCVPIIYGSSKVVAYHKNIVDVEDFHFQSCYRIYGNRDESKTQPKICILNTIKYVKDITKIFFVLSSNLRPNKMDVRIKMF